MKRLLVLALLSTGMLFGLVGSASADCTPPYCPSPSATTNQPSGVTATSAVLSGEIAANNAGATTYEILLGTSPSSLAVVASGNGPDGSGFTTPVSFTAANLTPGTTYFTQVRVSNKGGTSSGAVLSFTTAVAGGGASGGGGGAGGVDVPSISKVDPLGFTAGARDGSEKDPPYTYRIRGSLELPSGTPCGGGVTIRFKRGRKTVKTVITSVGSDCEYGETITVAENQLAKQSTGPHTLRVVVRYDGNDAINEIEHAVIFTVKYAVQSDN